MKERMLIGTGILFLLLVGGVVGAEQVGIDVIPDSGTTYPTCEGPYCGIYNQTGSRITEVEFHDNYLVHGNGSQIVFRERTENYPVAFKEEVDGKVADIDFSKNNEMVAVSTSTGFQDKSNITVFDYDNGIEERYTISGLELSKKYDPEDGNRSSTIPSIDFTPNNNYLVFGTGLGSNDRKIYVAHSDNGSISHYHRTGEEYVTDVATLNDKIMLAKSGCGGVCGGPVEVINFTTGDRIRKIRGQATFDMSEDWIAFSGGDIRERKGNFQFQRRNEDYLDYGYTSNDISDNIAIAGDYIVGYGHHHYNYEEPKIAVWKYNQTADKWEGEDTYLPERKASDIIGLDVTQEGKIAYGNGNMLVVRQINSEGVE